MKRINCTVCEHLLTWQPNLLKGDQPGYTLHCLEPDCQSQGKIQDFILLKDLVGVEQNPLAHIKIALSN